eukprot:1144633-Pelagomonas_calceolata.AAC.5
MEMEMQEGESYDVYVNQPKPLNEGEEKRIISVFVADESGMINRVAGVFARRRKRRDTGRGVKGVGGDVRVRGLAGLVAMSCAFPFKKVKRPGWQLMRRTGVLAWR